MPCPRDRSCCGGTWEAPQQASGTSRTNVPGTSTPNDDDALLDGDISDLQRRT